MKKKYSPEQIRNEQETSLFDFKKFFTYAPDAFFLADPVSGMILDCNLAALQLTGKSKDELIGQHQSELYPPQYKETAAKLFKQHVKAIKQGETVSRGEAYLATKNGKNIPVEISLQLIKLENKQIVIGVFRDITQRIKAEEELRKNRGYYKKALATTIEGVFDLDLLTRKVQFSKGFCRILHLPKEQREFSFEDWENRVHPEDNKIQKFLKQLYSQHASIFFDYRMKTGKGFYIWVSVRAQLLEEEERKHIFGTITDITDQKKRAEAVRILAETSPLLPYKQFLEKFSLSLAKIFDVKYAGFTFIEEDSGDFNAKVFYAADKFIYNSRYAKNTSPMADIKSKKSQFISNLPQENLQNPIIKEYNIICYWGVPIFDNKNKRLGHLFLMDDRYFRKEGWHLPILRLFAQRVGAETERQANEKQLKDKLDLEKTSREISQYLFSAPRSKEAFKKTLFLCAQKIGANGAYHFKESVGKLLLQDMWGKANFALDNFIETLQANPVDSLTTINPIYRGKNHKNIVILPIKDNEATFAYLVFVTSYLNSAIKDFLQKTAESLGLFYTKDRYQRVITASLQKTEEANLAKDGFLNAMSHELRTPLNGILGAARYLKSDTSLSETQQESVRVINESGERLLELINDILDMSALENDKITLTNIPFNLWKLLETLATNYRQKAKQKNLTFHLQKMPAVPNFVGGDEKHLSQVLNHLLSNALKNTFAGDIFFKVAVRNRTLIFKVEDTGRGIPRKQFKNIFQPFHKYKRRHFYSEGTGLGLAICHKLVNLMNGKIKLTSTVGKGSSFTLTLPLQIPPTWELVKMLPVQEETLLPEQENKITVFPPQEELEKLLFLAKKGNLELMKKELSKIRESGYDEFCDFYWQQANNFSIENIIADFELLLEQN